MEGGRPLQGRTGRRTDLLQVTTAAVLELAEAREERGDGDVVLGGAFRFRHRLGRCCNGGGEDLGAKA
jgi:hypothetical protein